MKRLLPILCCICAALAFLLAATAMGLLIACAVLPQLLAVTVFAVPLLVASTVTSLLSALVNFPCLATRLGKVGLSLSLISIALTVVGYIVILAM